MGVKFGGEKLFLLLLVILMFLIQGAYIAQSTPHMCCLQHHPKAKANAFDLTIFLQLCKYTGVFVLKLITMKAPQVHRIIPTQTSHTKQRFKMSGILPKDTEERSGW